MRALSGAHLSQEGVSLARQVGQDIGPFERVVTSTLPRAFETAIAMGFAVHEQVELMSTYGDVVEQEVPWPQSFAAYAKAIKRDKAAARYGQQLANFYSDLAASIPDGCSALVINHGGVVELGITASFPGADYESWGGPVSYCEGARLTWEDGMFVDAELLRMKA